MSDADARRATVEPSDLNLLGLLRHMADVERNWFRRVFAVVVGRRDGHPFGPVNLRWILVHMIEEYARHCGHADLLREHIDGTTGD